MTITYLPSNRERLAIERAGCHAVADELIQPEARWQHGVTDLDAARVLLALEHEGIAFTRSSTGRWYPPPLHKLTGNASIVINEMIRVGLLINVPWVELVPAKVHLMTAFRVTACREAGENMGPKRVRLHADPIIVDCLACLDPL